MDFLFGVIGFGGFEALRIYKCLWGGYPVLPINHKYFYASVVFVVALFSGAVASVLSHGNLGEAVFIGFSVPTGIKAILDKPSSTAARLSTESSHQDHTDDITLNKPKFKHYLVSHYFGYR